MKFTLLLFSAMFLISSSSVAATPPGLKAAVICGNSVSSAKVWSDAEQFYFRLDDSEGFQNFPIYTGVVGPAQVPLINRAADELKVFNGIVLITWPKEKCKVDAKRPLFVQCSGHGTIVQPVGTTFTPTGISTSVETQETMDLTASTLTFNLGLDTPFANYTHYFLGFPFDKNNCSSNVSL